MKRYNVGSTDGHTTRWDGSPTGKAVFHSDLRAELLPVLKRLEWLGNEMNELWCEECRKENPHHAPDCALAALIAFLEAP